MKILIVDDSRTARMIIRNQLEQREMFNFFEAENGREAVILFKKESPDITFLDLNMPIMDGYKALEEIKKRAPGAIVLVLSADIEKKTVERVTNMGAFKFLKKPSNQTDLQQALNEALTVLKSRV